MDARDDTEAKWAYLVALDDDLLRGGVTLSEWASFLGRDADVAFVHGAHLACVVVSLAGVETHLRSESGSASTRLVELIDNSQLEPELISELHALRRYRNRWVHVADPSDDAALLVDPAKHEGELEEMAKRCVAALRRVLYSNPWT